MPKFAVLLNHKPARYQNLSEDEYMSIIKDYVAWVEKTTAAGAYFGGEKLRDEAGKQIRGTANSLEIHDSPFLEASEVLGGFMLLKADSMDAAIDLIRDHPHLEHNTSLEIRQVDEHE